MGSTLAILNTVDNYFIPYWGGGDHQNSKTGIVIKAYCRAFDIKVL